MKKLLMVLTLLFVCMIAYLHYTNSGEDEIHLIPKGFSGVVVIIFDDKNGHLATMKNGNRVYNIPKNGILKTRFKMNNGNNKKTYYYVDADGNQTKLVYTFPEDNYPADSIQVYFGSVGSGNTAKTKKEINYMSYIVGKVSDADILEKEKNNLHVDDL